jgi:16S rRNA C967 or C1407 C5-methylase (RsmB/RsmF family)
VDAFLASNLGFVLRPPSGAPAAVPPWVLDPRGCLATFPFRHGLDAFFAAVLERRQAT